MKIVDSIILVFFFINGYAQNNIYNKLGEAPVVGGLEMEEYWVWGSSVTEQKHGTW